MRQYTDDEINEYRKIMGHRGGINRKDVELALDLVGEELGIVGPDTSHIAENTFNELIEKNLQLPDEYVGTGKNIPEVPDVTRLNTGESDMDWRKPKLNRAQKLADMATWMTPEERAALQSEINQYIDAFDVANPPDEFRVPKDENYYRKPEVNIGISSRYLGIPEDNHGLSKSNYAQLDRNNLTANGCGSGWSSFIPDETRFGNYTQACNLHDTLYGIPGMPKQRADELFNDALKHEVASSPHYKGKMPNEHLYARGVRKYGDDAYADAQKVGQKSWRGGWHPLQDY